MRLIITALVTCLATAAAADINVKFRDGAPKDRFTITNTAACSSGPIDLTIDLSSSPSGLIFDVTGSGAGVEVFQPFELVSGTDSVAAVSDVSDGDTELTLTLTPMAPGAEVAFTIDLDDTVGTREITVSGSEIEGAGIFVNADGEITQGMFDANGVAMAQTVTCMP